MTARRTRRPLAAALAAALGLALTAGLAALVGPAGGPAAAAPARPVVTDACLTSVPDPGTTEPVEICYSLFRPAGATKARPVPMVLHSHGWGGSRTTDPAAFEAFLEAGYAVLSFDQRGFGASGGQAYVENPQVEGHDVRRLVKLVARLPWVRQDGPGDPRMGAIGGSYGGGYQFLAAFESLRRTGRPVLDALAPEITWYDLAQSLAPEGVVRTTWAAALSAAALPTQALPTFVYQGLVEGAATGTLPDGSLPGGQDLVAFFEKNGPKWHVDNGRRLDVPVLFGQGTTDSLFPLEQGLQIFDRALTRRARAQSVFLAYNGGHVLPAAVPMGISLTSDPCSRRLTGGGTFRDLTIRFFDQHLRGRTAPAALRAAAGRYHLATPQDTCTVVDEVRAETAVPIGVVATPELAGAPVGFEVAQGPIRVAGTPYLTGSVTALGVENRAFYGLAVGTNPLDARLVQNNVLPFRSVAPVVGEQRRIDLPSVAVDVPEGQSLFLLTSPISDIFATMGSRTPGAVVVQDAVVHLPVVGRR